MYICTHMLRIENIFSFQVHQENEKKQNSPFVGFVFLSLMCTYINNREQKHTIPAHK